MRTDAEKLRQEHTSDLEKVVTQSRDKNDIERQKLEARNYDEVAAARRDAMNTISSMEHQMRGILTEKDAAGAKSSRSNRATTTRIACCN